MADNGALSLGYDNAPLSLGYALQDACNPIWICVFCLTRNRQSGDVDKAKLVDTLSLAAQTAVSYWPVHNAQVCLNVCWIVPVQNRWRQIMTE